MTIVSVVCGASGQDGWFLVRRLLAEGGIVHAVVRNQGSLDRGGLPDRGELHVHVGDILNPKPLTDLIAATQPDEVYNLAGQSSVSRSFQAPMETWRMDADFVMALLEEIRSTCSHARVYQASTTEMFGTEPDGESIHNELSRFNPQSPYAFAKAAAHFACGVYRQSFGIRVGCGILSNHESHLRPRPFLTRKIADHARSLQGVAREDLLLHLPLAVGNLKIQRDWGFAPDYVDGMMRIIRQIEVRGAGEEDVARNYRDYVLGTGRSTAVWQLIDRAFALVGHELRWYLEGNDPAVWRATFASTGAPAVVTDPDLFRPSDPTAIVADAALARRELGWQPHTDVDSFLRDMILRKDVGAACE